MSEGESEGELEYMDVDRKLVDRIAKDSVVWSCFHGLVVADKSYQASGFYPGIGLAHAPFALLPARFPEKEWREASDLAPIINHLVHRVSSDATFLHESFSKSKKLDEFTSRLLDIHSKMLQINKKEEIQLGLHRSDYLLDEKTKSLFLVELKTISSPFAGLSSLVTQLHRYILSRYGKLLGLDSERIPANGALDQYAEALAKAWSEYNNPRAVIMIVVLAEEQNMYDQYLVSTVLNDRYPFLICYNTYNITTIRKTLAEVDQQGEILPDGTLSVDGEAVSVIYFRAGCTPVDYPSESEWRARLLMERSCAVKCPSISYHLVGSKRIQQELAKPGVLERFLENKDDIVKLRKCFAGLWSLDDSDIVEKAIESPKLFMMKPLRKEGGKNIYGYDVRETLLRWQKRKTIEDAAYFLMQRIFPTISSTVFMDHGLWIKERASSELGIFSTYLRNKDKVIINKQSGYLMRTIGSTLSYGEPVPWGFPMLDSVYLTDEPNNT
uniref:Glutathione synthetase n=1 Tax=Cajanus cajan TaxID=3821 RepID=A0A151TW05_CAJCA|nr:hypothetical protein KK1_010508 [Cajanus cajan]